MAAARATAAAIAEVAAIAAAAIAVAAIAAGDSPPRTARVHLVRLNSLARTNNLSASSVIY